MNNTNENKRQFLDLQYLQATLQDADFATRLTEKSADFDLSFLTVDISSEQISKPAYAQLMFIPTAAMLEETNLLQFFAYLSEEEFTATEEITSYLRFLNTRSPMGYFSLDKEDKLFYRYVLASPRFTVAVPGMFKELFELYSNTFQVFGANMLALAKGEITLEAAKAGIGE